MNTYIFFKCIYIFFLLYRVHKVLRLLVASAEGYLYVYNLDSTEGGDCTLLKQHRFVFLILKNKVYLKFKFKFKIFNLINI